MADWLSYSITDFIPFSRDSYLRLAQLYNARFAPFVVFGQALGLAVLVMVWRTDAWRLRLALGGFALSWLWIGWAYQIESLAPLLWRGEVLGIAFALQSGLLMAAALLPFPGDAPPVMQRWIGFHLLLLAILLSLPLGLLADRSWSELAWFGTAPDPTAVATLGLAAMLPPRLMLLLIPLPLLWCLLAVTMQVAMADALWLLPAVGAAVSASLLVGALLRLLARHSGHDGA
jgi:hypothetical protein